MAKKEALEAGLYPSYAEFEWYSYSNEEKQDIEKAFSRIYKNVPVKIQKGQRVLSEHYTFNGT